MPKIIGLILAIMLSSFVLVIVIGYALPTQHVAARAIFLPLLPTEVFAVISNFKDAPAWRTELHSVEMLPPIDGRVRFREKGKNHDITLEVVESNPPHRLVTRIADPKLPFGGFWIFEIVPASEGCRLNITERGEVYNPVFRFFSRFILGYTATLDAYLKNAGRKFGSTAAPEEGLPAPQ